MKTRAFSLFIAMTGMIALTAMSPAIADDTVMRLASLEWSPYVGSQLRDEGLTASIVKVTARQIGIDTKISYAPWSRTVQVGGTDPAYAGYFPAFYTKERESSCYFSGILGRSIVGFAYLKKRPFDWLRLSDLQAYKIGIVQDYANGEEFDAMIKKGLLKTDTAPSDVSNLRKLLAQRIDVIVIDKNVLRQLLITEPGLQANRDQIEFHPQELTNFSMHICFQHTERGLAMRKSFNAALEKVDIKKFENTYFKLTDAAGSR
ncbi:substrate-binding periplasmic protein [Undibacterium sp. Rencai35W]|uniref:substrate-binding periplasmic protein n=1 Tax=Undibacterium sp. Rencai35W TaxID=3413046 RepID=UPI003BF2D775